MNIPLGILSIIGIWFFLHEQIEKKKQEIDYKGAILLTIRYFYFYDYSC